MIQIIFPSIIFVIARFKLFFAKKKKIQIITIHIIWYKEHDSYHSIQRTKWFESFLFSNFMLYGDSN